MSDYGFKTDDKDRSTILNAKNPIFGFDMRHSPRAFKTFHFVDAKTSAIKTGSVATPNPQPYGYWDWAENMDYGTVTELIKKVKHGYNFRPVGYATITGHIKISYNVRIEQTQRAGSYGGNYSKNLSKTQGDNEYELVPNVSGRMFVSVTESGLTDPVVQLTPQDFSGTVWPNQNPKNILTNIPYGPYSGGIEEFQNPYPEALVVEIDNEYIYFYRKYRWSDTIRRVKYTNYDNVTTDDIKERVKIATQYTGSEYNVTVYLCPFPIEELLTSTNSPVSPTNIGVWDESLWDSGKEWG